MDTSAQSMSEHQINWDNPYYDVNLDVSIIGLLWNRLAILYPTPTSHLLERLRNG